MFIISLSVYPPNFIPSREPSGTEFEIFIVKVAAFNMGGRGKACA